MPLTSKCFGWAGGCALSPEGYAALLEPLLQLAGGCTAVVLEGGAQNIMLGTVALPEFCLCYPPIHLRFFS